MYRIWLFRHFTQVFLWNCHQIQWIHSVHTLILVVELVPGVKSKGMKKALCRHPVLKQEDEVKIIRKIKIIMICHIVKLDQEWIMVKIIKMVRIIETKHLKGSPYPTLQVVNIGKDNQDNWGKTNDLSPSQTWQGVNTSPWLGGEPRHSQYQAAGWRCCLC